MAYDPGSGRPIPGLAVLPVDLDDDDAINPDEAACAKLGALDAAVTAGHYPAGLVRALRLTKAVFARALGCPKPPTAGSA